jgi:ABC-type Zn uptake system ZnuABC Zn-binding protein ZnuA
MNTPFLFFAVAACLLSTAVAEEKIKVSSFSTVLTEVATKVGGNRVEVYGHIKPGVDPHDFQPKPSDLKIVSESALVLLSAKHMEGYIGKLKEATGQKNTIVEVGDEFPSMTMKQAHDHDHDHAGTQDRHAHFHHHDHDHDGKIEDPHWWHSVANMKRATKIVRDRLTKVSPGDEAAFAKNAEAYLAELDSLQKWVKTKLAELPRDRRKLVTSHDAFQYFAKENGFTIYAIEGLSSADQPSSKAVAEIISKIKNEGVKAIFPESIQNPKVLEQITKETGVKLGDALHADGLGEGKASTYAGMIKANVTAIVDALK